MGRLIRSSTFLGTPIVNCGRNRAGVASRSAHDRGLYRIPRTNCLLVFGSLEFANLFG